LWLSNWGMQAFAQSEGWGGASIAVKRGPGRRKRQYISLKTKGGNRRQESSNLAYYQKVKQQGAFDVQITRNDDG
jgi:hypothetical protein